MSKFRPFHLLLSKSPDFTNPLKDISLNSSNYLLTAPSLEPSTQHYWQITNGTESKTGTFFTQNPFKNIGNTYLANVTRSCWGGAGNCDSTYLDSITVFWVGKKLKMNVNSLGLNTSLDYIPNPYFSHDNILLYAENLYSNNSRSLQLDYNSHQAAVSYSSGGLGGGVHYYFEFSW